MKTTFLKWLGLFLVGFLLQTTIVPVIDIHGIHPDIPMVMLFFLASRTGPLPSLWAGFVLGLAENIYSPSIPGQNALAKTVSGFLAGLFNERVVRIDIIVQLILLCSMFLVHDAIFLIVQSAKTGGSGVFGIIHHLLVLSLPRALYSMPFALLPHIKNHFFMSSSSRL